METLKNRHEIKLKKPARYWDDGLPIGNGRLGAMVMGKVNEETIYLNEETIWYGRDLDRKNPDTGKYLDQIRELLFAGEVEKAQFLAKMAITSTPKYMNPYQPAGDLRICMYHHKGGGFRKQLELKKFKLFFLCIMHKEEGEENDKPRVVQSKQKEIM